MMEASPEFRGHHDVTAVGQPTGMAERTTSRMTEQSQPFSSWPPVPDVPRSVFISVILLAVSV